MRAQGILFLSQIVSIGELYHTVAYGIGFENDDLVFTFFKERSGDVQGLLRSSFVVISADIYSVYGDKAVGKSTWLNKGIARRTIYLQRSFEESGKAFSLVCYFAV